MKLLRRCRKRFVQLANKVCWVHLDELLGVIWRGGPHQRAGLVVKREQCHWARRPFGGSGGCCVKDLAQGHCCGDYQKGCGMRCGAVRCVRRREMQLQPIWKWEQTNRYLKRRRTEEQRTSNQACNLEITTRGTLPQPPKGYRTKTLRTRSVAMRLC